MINRKYCFESGQKVHQSKKERFKRLNSTRASYFLPKASANRYHWEKIKEDKKNLLTSRQQKNTFGKHWGKKKFWFGDATAHHFTCPVWSYANSISRHISIHASFKEAAFKLTFRLKRHFRTSRVRDQERAGAKKKTGPSKSFCMPRGDDSKLKSPIGLEAH